MARARSPEYPAISLKEALDRVKMIYGKDYQNRLPKKVIAEHMGYKGLSGASLPILSALTKYGLLEGRADETRVSDLAVSLIAHAPGTPERIAALKQASAFPELFAELDERFPGGASDQAIRSYLLTSKFIPGAADAAIRAYRDTKQLVEAESGGYTAPNSEQEPPVRQTETLRAQSLTTGAPVLGSPALKQHAAFPLPEGDVSLSFPADLSVASAQMMASFVNLLLKQAEQQAKIRESAKKDEAAPAEGEKTKYKVI